MMLQKIEKIIFYVFLFSIPFQIRKILFYQKWGFIEWQSFSIYATDLLLILLFIFWVISLIKNNSTRSSFKIQFYDYFIFALIVVSAISIKNAINPTLGFYQLIKLAEFVFFYLYIKCYAINRFNFDYALITLIASGIFQSIIGILQFIKKSNIGLKILGESPLNINASGVAVFFNTAGEKVMRAYGTTPHPNVLATFLFLTIFAFYFVWIYKRKIGTIDYILLAGYGIMLFAFFLTFSRTFIFIWLCGFIIRGLLILFKKDFYKKYWLDNQSRKKLLIILFFTIAIGLLFAIFFWSDVLSRLTISGNEEAVQLRMFYNSESLKTNLNLFGVGIGNFVSWLMAKNPNLLARIYQPVHNIYLLIYSETGLLGISAFALFLIFLIKDFIYKTKLRNLYHYSFLLVLLSLLTIGLFDHFLWTLQQGRFIFWMVLALISSSKEYLKT